MLSLYRRNGWRQRTALASDHQSFQGTGLAMLRVRKVGPVVIAALLTASCGSGQHSTHVSGAATVHPSQADAQQSGETGADKPERGKLFHPETPNNAKFNLLKAQANAAAKARSGRVSSHSPTTSPAPTLILNKAGVHDAAGWYPTDANGARGGTRYVEVINNTVGFYSASLGLVATDTTFNLTGTTSTYVGDPEIIFDQASKKFFYVLIDQDAAGNWRLDYGFSKTASPSSTNDFCHYQMPTSGTSLTDYPRLGATRDFLLIGENNYAGGSSYTGSSVYWATKPAAADLTTCPPAPTNGQATGFQFTPVPAHQTDPSSVGYILSSVWSGGSSLTKYTVTKSAAGTPVFSGGTSVPVTSYSIPANADQPGTTDMLSTNDARLYQVLQSWDNGAAVLWTSHTIFGGNGAAARWYEISTSGTVLQSGTIADANLDYYYPTISSDRAYKSKTSKGFGQNMVIGFNQSSSTTSVGVDVASEQGRTGVSPVIVASAGDGTHISCGGTCRWGDRSSAHPGLSAVLTNPTGRVWLSQSIVAADGYNTRNLQVAP